MPIDKLSANHQSLGLAVAECVESDAETSLPHFRPAGCLVSLQRSINKVVRCMGTPLLLALDEVQVRCSGWANLS